jgi:Immunity protein 40
MMNKISNYLNYLREKGRPLSEINPGSDEIALAINDALEAIELLEGTQSAILGGDILSDESGKLTYIYDNWYSEKMDSESQEDYANKSYEIAKNYINEVIKRAGKNIYVVIVI